MPPNTPVFILGLAVGTSLLVIGLLLGYWFGRKAAPVADTVDRQQFLSFLRNLSNWTSEFSGDVIKYQTQLTNINERVRGGDAPPREEIVGLLSQIMQANQQLQERLDSAEQKLESQTDQISNYLTEARTDGLTGLFNRRAFDKAVDELYSDWQKKEQTFSLCLIDIDHFKQINDTYGHPAGDAVLKHVSGMLQAELSDSVCVARYGGEEFAMLTLAPIEEAAATLDRMRNAVSKVEVKHEEHIISVTLSGGVSQIEPDDKIGKLVRRADEALYASKLGGRNRVYLHDGTICQLVTKIAVDKTLPSPVDTLTAKEAHVADAMQSKMQQRLQRIVEEESKRMANR